MCFHNHIQTFLFSSSHLKLFWRLYVFSPNEGPLTVVSPKSALSQPKHRYLHVPRPTCSPTITGLLFVRNVLTPFEEIWWKMDWLQSHQDKLYSNTDRPNPFISSPSLWTGRGKAGRGKAGRVKVGRTNHDRGKDVVPFWKLCTYIVLKPFF